MYKYFIFIILLFSTLGTTNAFFGDPSGLDLYKNIDGGVEKLNKKMLEFELKGKDDNILKEVNNLAYLNNIPKCLDESISITTEITNKIAVNGNISLISQFINNDICSDNSLELLSSYLNIFKKHYYNSNSISKKKTDQIYKMSSVGIYSDGILENSGFDLLVDIENIDKIIFNDGTDFEGEENVDIKSIINNNSSKEYPFITNSYKKETDNGVLPCEGFLCINIEMKTNSSGGGENTIEFLIDRSNEHLKDFAASSLIQSKMTSDLFEISLKDLDLPSIFHLSTYVIKRNIPILDIEDNGKKDNTEFSSNNIFENHYKKNGLNYKRRNDLSLLRSTEAEYQSVINSEDLNIENLGNKVGELKVDYLSNEKSKIDILNKSAEKKGYYGITNNFENQYIELNKFTEAIHDYVEALHAILKNMLKIPVDNGIT